MNDNSGLSGSQSEKLVADLQQKIRLTKIDHDFYSNGFQFSGVEKQSANHFFGNGKWKNAVRDAFGEETFKQKATYYGNRPTDFYIASIKTDYASYFNPSESIVIKDKTGTYSGNMKVLFVPTDKKSIVVMLPFVEGSNSNTGVIYNASRTVGAEKALRRFEQALNDIAPASKIVSEPAIEKEHKREEMVSNFTDQPEKPADRPLPIETKINWKPVIAIILLLAAIGGIYYLTTKNPKTNV